ncbi:MAG TPA: hypothetical protein VJ625_10215, partial [Propionibacteriaceae bacterium]|nr:hypothetical protein [Propionibacteriaceae bacterium]
VDQNPDALGKAAATRLFQRLDNPDRRRKRRMVLPVQLLLRASCAGTSPSGNGETCHQAHE